MRKMYSRRVSPEFEARVKAISLLLNVKETEALELAISLYYTIALQVLSQQHQESSVITQHAKLGAWNK